MHLNTEAQKIHEIFSRTCKSFLLEGFDVPFPSSGTLFLWLFWPSFNGVLASGNAQTRAVINTYYAMTASVLGTFIFSLLFNRKKGKLSMVSIKFCFSGLG